MPPGTFFLPTGLIIFSIFTAGFAMRFNFFRQAVNSSSLRKIGLVVKRPGLLLPDLSLASVADLDLVKLKEAHGIKYILFDKDNTLSLCYVDELHDSVRDTVDRSRNLFGENAIAILSNSVGSCDDEGYEGASATEARMKIPVIRHAKKKPDCIQDVLVHFTRHQTFVRASEICMVGDRVLTDVLFGNLHGMFSVLVKPLSIRTDHPVAVVIRIIERSVLIPILRLAGVKRDRSFHPS